MKYSDDFFIKLNREVNSLIKVLEECRFAGSFETKIDLNIVIKLLANQSFVINELRNELKQKFYGGK